MTRLLPQHLRLVVRVGARQLGIGRGGLQAAPLLAAGGLALGAATLLVVLAVMNGFQLGFIEDILEIGSYHLRVTPAAGAAAGGSEAQRVAAALAAVPEVRAVVPFAELPALVTGTARGLSGAAPSRGLLLRVVPPEVRRLDPAFARHVEVVAGEFAVDTPASIVLGAELARHLRVVPGDRVTVVTLSGAPGGSGGGAFRPRREQLTVRGLFRSGLYEYDLGWGFVGPSTALAAAPDRAAGTPFVYGLKLDNRFRDLAALAAVRRALAAAVPAEAPVANPAAGPAASAADPAAPAANRAAASAAPSANPTAGPAASAAAPAASAAAPSESLAAEVESWRTFNRALFAALRVEKLLLAAILGLVFVVVAYNILQGLRRRVVERSAELGLLRALGAAPWVVRGVFVWEGALLGLLGAAAGVALGLLLAYNVGGLFAALEAVANAVLALAARLSGAGAAGAGAVEIFSPATFYLAEVPSRLLLSEVLLVAAFTVAAPALAGLAVAARAGRAAAAAALRSE